MSASEFTAEPLTDANKAALESMASESMAAAPAPNQSSGGGCLPADAEALRLTFEQLAQGQTDAAALWERFQAKSDPTGLVQLAMRTRDNVRLLEERIAAFPLGMKSAAFSLGTPAATPAASSAPPPAPPPVPAVPQPAAGAAATRAAAAAQPAGSIMDARQKAQELNIIFEEAITCVGDVLAACSGHIDKFAAAAAGSDSSPSVAEAAQTVRLAYSELARARRAAQSAIAGERAVSTMLESDMQSLAGKAARLDMLEGQSSDDRALALRLREQADKATAALEEATRKAEDYRLQLAASAQAAQRVKEKEASLAQQQVTLSELVERAARQMSTDSAAAQKAAEEATAKAVAALRASEERIKEVQAEHDTSKVEIQQLKSDLVAAKLTSALHRHVV